MTNITIKNPLVATAVAVALMLGFSAMSYVSTYSRSIEPSTFRSFSATGEGKVVAIPDVARFSFSVITEGGKDLAALQEQNIEKTNKAVAFVKSQGVDDKDIKTEGYNVSPRYQYYSCDIPRNGSGNVCPPAEIVGYTITQTVSIKARNFDKVGAIIAGVVENGANTTSQLSFEIDDPTEVQNQAREEAIAKAKARAVSIARAGGFSLGKLLSIEEGFYPYYGYGRGGADFGVVESKISSAPSIEPGSNEVSVSVTLRYEIR